MSRRGSYFDFTPEECDARVLRDIKDKRDEVKAKAKSAKPKKVGVELLLDQPHTSHDGKKLVSHLICVPKGQQVHWALKRMFVDNPRSGKEDRANWNPSSDAGLRRKMDGYDIYWLCPAHMYDADWVTGIVKAIYQGYKNEDVEITNRVAVEF